MNKLYIWRTARIVQETPDTITIEFNTGAEKFDYKAGQFINITILVNGAPVTRSYSLSSAPGVDEQPAVTIKKVPGGLMSSYIVDNAENVQHWQVDGPYGAFIRPLKSQHIVLLAAGSGFTPCFSIAKSVLHHLPTTQLTIIYANRSTEYIIFNGMIEKWIDTFKNRITIIHALSQQAQDMKLPTGELVLSRLNKIIVKKLIKKHVPGHLPEAHYFICGPSSLIKIQEESLAELAVPSENIFVERFRPDENPKPVELPQDMHEVMLHFYEQSNLLEVRPGTSILTSALEDRITLPYSCNSGTCGKCTARLTAGAVTMVSNYVLRKEELDAGMILLCQSYPLNDEVTIEIDV
ncbi:iron-sulfur cluster-binding domain-containing protein [Paraflavitalea sp. CAU 1676]|uniref:flavin reductase family protein n=1 Tax=Paraflavitalea sp. CAU 1676 TaxID=3032598 RepID=UPI0023DA0DD4|nr:iron-sulfur cluster-binding domain-containing protein [Paraflavitalea sp. CAU 1676]MDF2191342.1 iron-sulfur cluster-binding domain-containing protein [Paraflavitalea sp. CAU 1676]